MLTSKGVVERATKIMEDGRFPVHKWESNAQTKLKVQVPEPDSEQRITMKSILSHLAGGIPIRSLYPQQLWKEKTFIVYLVTEIKIRNTFIARLKLKSGQMVANLARIR